MVNVLNVSTLWDVRTVLNKIKTGALSKQLFFLKDLIFLFLNFRTIAFMYLWVFGIHLKLQKCSVFKCSSNTLRILLEKLLSTVPSWKNWNEEKSKAPLWTTAVCLYLYYALSIPQLSKLLWKLHWRISFLKNAIWGKLVCNFYGYRETWLFSQTVWSWWWQESLKPSISPPIGTNFDLHYQTFAVYLMEDYFPSHKMCASFHISCIPWEIVPQTLWTTDLDKLQFPLA